MFLRQALTNPSSIDRTAVEHSGLGLWMIGGEQFFGVGGYLHTPLEKVLP